MSQITSVSGVILATACVVFSTGVLADDDAEKAAREKFAAAVNKRLDKLMSDFGSGPLDSTDSEKLAYVRVGGSKLLDEEPARALKRDREPLLACAMKLYDKRKEREYKVATTVKWVEFAWMEYREEVGIGNHFDQNAFLSVADQLAYVEVASDPDNAVVTVANIRFTKKTKSDGFVKVEPNKKTRIHIEKDGYDDLNVAEQLTPKKTNSFSYTLTATN